MSEANTVYPNIDRENFEAWFPAIIEPLYTMSDANVLEELKRWNRGEPPLDRVIASTDGKSG